LWSWEVDFVVATSLTSIVVALVIRSRTGITRERALLIAGCLALLSLSRPCDLAVVPALALWLGYAGVRCWFVSETPPEAASFAPPLAGACLLLVVCYFVGYQRPEHHPTNPVWGPH
jgi:hypothetical protein